jgi:hypothetical protein
METIGLTLKFTLHPLFIEPGVDVIHKLLQAIGVKDSICIIRI